MTVFPVTEFNYRMALTANTMVGFNTPIIDFNSNLVDNFAKGFFMLIIRDWGGYTHNLHKFSPRILGICPVLPLHVNKAIVELAINIFSYSKVRFESLKTFIMFTYLLSKLCIWRFHFILHLKHHCYQFLFNHCYQLLSIAINHCYQFLLSILVSYMYLNKNKPSYKIKL